MKRCKGIISAFIMCFCIYFLLTLNTFSITSITIQELIGGVVVSLIVAVITESIFIKTDGFYIFKKNRLIHLIKYIVIYPYYLLMANIDVALIALGFKLKINPAIVKVNTKLKSDYGLALLSNSITLTPGTITMDVIDHGDETKLFVHCLNIEPDKLDKADQIIKDDFEAHIRTVFD